GLADVARAVDGVTQHVHDPPQGLGPDRHRDRFARVTDLDAALQALARAHGDGAHDAVAELLLDLEGEIAVGELQGVVHLRQRITRELDVDDRADDLNYCARTHGSITFLDCGR